MGDSAKEILTRKTIAFLCVAVADTAEKYRLRRDSVTVKKDLMSHVAAKYAQTWL